MTTYITVSGDTFDKIAFEQLGSEYLFPLLLKENPKHRTTVVFSAGIELNIPDIQVNEYQEVPEWLEPEDEMISEQQNEKVLSGIDA